MIEWAGEKNLCLLNPTDISTHNRGGTLDLAYCSQIGAKCEIPLDLHTTSDHETLVTSIPLSGDINQDTSGRLRYNSLDKDLFIKILSRNQENSMLHTEEDIHVEAAKIVETIHSALLAACPRANNKQKGTAWWNNECKEAARKYRLARRIGHFEHEKRELRNAVRRAKKEYWKSRMEKLESLRDVYKIVKWHNTAPRFHTPPLKDPNRDVKICCPKEKAKLSSQSATF